MKQPHTVTGLESATLIEKLEKVSVDPTIYLNVHTTPDEFYLLNAETPLELFGPFPSILAIAEYGNRPEMALAGAEKSLVFTGPHAAQSVRDLSRSGQAAQDLRDALEDVPMPFVSYKDKFQKPTFRNQIESQINFIVASMHGLAREAGHWTCLESGEEITKEGLHHMPKMEMVGWIASKLLLTHGEISEGVEGFRCDKMDDKLPHRSMLECELADVVIRAADLAGLLELDLGGAIAEKSAFNAFRPDHTLEERRKKNGKLF